MQLASLVGGVGVLFATVALAAPGDALLVTGSNVNVRAGPSTEAGVLIRVGQNEPAIERMRQEAWVEVDLPNQDVRGWIHDSLLTGTTIEPTAVPLGHHLEDRTVGRQRHVLLEPGDAQARLPPDCARIDWQLSAENLQQRRLTRPVPADDRDPLPRWSFGRATLLGDAAHPMYPTGSNGASQAILDARAPARLLASGAPIPEALAAYAAERRPATAEIVLASRRGGPEGVIDLVEGRAPYGFDDLDAVANHSEREAIVHGYASLAGFSQAEANRAM